LQPATDGQHGLSQLKHCLSTFLRLGWTNGLLVVGAEWRRGGDVCFSGSTRPAQHTHTHTPSQHSAQRGSTAPQHSAAARPQYACAWPHVRTCTSAFARDTAAMMTTKSGPPLPGCCSATAKAPSSCQLQSAAAALQRSVRCAMTADAAASSSAATRGLDGAKRNTRCSSSIASAVCTCTHMQRERGLAWRARVWMQTRYDTTPQDTRDYVCKAPTVGESIQARS
jgi:hypothetical protein